MSLLSLSLVRVTGQRRVPRVLTNDERMRAYRAATPAQFANETLAERIRAAAYAKAEALDGRYPTTDTHRSTK